MHALPQVAADRRARRSARARAAHRRRRRVVPPELVPGRPARAVLLRQGEGLSTPPRASTSRSTKAAARRTPCRSSPRARTRSASPIRRASSSTASKGADIKSVMSLLNSTGFSVVSLAETGIKTPKDLEGKKRRGDRPAIRSGSCSRRCARPTSVDCRRSRWCRSIRRRRSSRCWRRRPTRCSAAPTTSTS